MAGRYAFVGLSKAREKRHFGGLPIEERRDQLKCAVYAVDTETAQVVGFLEFERGCEELFDVAVLPERRWPAVLGVEKHACEHIFTVP